VSSSSSLEVVPLVAVAVAVVVAVVVVVAVAVAVVLLLEAPLVASPLLGTRSAELRPPFPYRRLGCFFLTRTLEDLRTESNTSVASLSYVTSQDVLSRESDDKPPAFSLAVVAVVVVAIVLVVASVSLL
jgi:hypothetical protein